MAQHWHILLPYAIAIEDKPGLIAAFEEKYKSVFLFDKVLEYQQITPVNSGHSLTFTRRELCYRLDNEWLREEFLVFYRLLLFEFRKMYGGNSKEMYSHVFETDLLEEFLRSMEDLNCKGFELKCIEQIKRISSNYFLHFEVISPQIVPEGYPLIPVYHSRIEVACLIHSYEPMNQSARETLVFHNFTEYIVEKLRKRFKIAEFLFTAGY